MAAVSGGESVWERRANSDTDKWAPGPGRDELFDLRNVAFQFSLYGGGGGGGGEEEEHVGFPPDGFTQLKPSDGRRRQIFK